MNPLRHKYLLAIFFLLFPFLARTQTPETAPRYEVGFNYFRGFVMKHDKYMGHLSKGITRGAELSFIRKSDGRSAWQRLTNYPDVGLSLSFFDYPTPVLGKTLALNSFTDYFLIRSKKFSSSLRLGIGLAYQTNPYDKETNNKNIVFGSPVTFSLQAKLNLKYEIAQNWLINGAVGLSHFSCADLKRPNKGLNIMAGYLGVSHFIGQSNDVIHPSAIDKEFSRKLRFSINFNGAPVHYKIIDSKVYPAFSLSAHVQKPVSRLFDLQLGVDLFNNSSMAEVIKDDRDLDATDLPDHKKAGISGGIEYHMNKISIQFNLGYYLYAPYKGPFGSLYQRYGLKFYVNDHIFINTGFKSHRADAENAEFGLGYRF